MARYLVMKRDNDIEVVKEEQSQIVSLSFGDFIEELASPHYERYGVRSIVYWDIDEESSARELVEESEDDEEAMDVTWNDFLDRWDCWVWAFSHFNHGVVSPQEVLDWYEITTDCRKNVRAGIQDLENNGLIER